MARRRVSRLQKRILRLLVAEYHRTREAPPGSHYKIDWPWAGDKGNISHSLRTLEERGWLVILRTPGGQANSIDLTRRAEKCLGNLKKVVIKTFV